MLTFKTQEVMSEYGPVEPLLRSMRRSVPFIGAGDVPPERIVPLMEIFSPISSYESLADGPASEAVRSGAGVTLKKKLYVVGRA